MTSTAGMSMMPGLPLLFAFGVLAGFEVLARAVVPMMGHGAVAWKTKKERHVPVQSSHHDALDGRDWLCITFSRLITIPFAYHLVVFCCASDSVVWPSGAHGAAAAFPADLPSALFTADGFAHANDAVVSFLGERAFVAANATSIAPGASVEAPKPALATIAHHALAIALLYVTYDFFYYWLHRTLHLRSLYKYCHKHHHRQHAPTRGNLDAINVHPFEFICGEYNHLLAVFLVGNALRAVGLGGVPVGAVLFFIVVGGALASLNHTRFNVRFGALAPFYAFDRAKEGATPAYEVAAHDVHHRLPTKNYGQYLMCWDMMFGSHERLVDKTASRAKAQ